MMSRSSLRYHLGFVVLSLTFSPLPLLAEGVVTLEGDLVEGRILGIDPEGRVEVQDQAAPWALDDLRALQPIAPAATVGEDPQEIVLTNGSRLYGRGLQVTDETVEMKSPILGELSIPIDFVWAFRLGVAEPDSRFAQATERMREHDRDIIFVTGTGTAEMQEAVGLIESLGVEELSFMEEDDEVRRIPALQVHGVILASPLMDVADLSGVPCTIFLQDGSRCVASVQYLKEGELAIELVDGLEWKLPWSLVRRINVKSDRLAYLSDLEPAQVFEEAIYAYPRSWKRDRNIRGGPLVIGDERFEKGLGTAAGTRLVFANSDEYDLFTASVGIDTSRGDWGDCEFVVYGDGRELLRRRLRGSEPSAFLKVPVRHVREITLHVEPGGGALDLSDDADWGDACLVQLTGAESPDRL